jgi:hypothetical protein
MPGKATLRLSFPDWKQGVAATTVELSVVEP